jgi:hypothetical protein
MLLLADNHLYFVVSIYFALKVTSEIGVISLAQTED